MNKNIYGAWSRRALLAGTAGSIAAASSLRAATGTSPGRLKQSVCKWCYRDLSVDELAEHAVRMGLRSVELLEEEQWPLLERYGLVCAVGMGICSITDGLNVKANHARIEANFRRLLPAAKKSGLHVPGAVMLAK